MNKRNRQEFQRKIPWQGRLLLVLYLGLLVFVMFILLHMYEYKNQEIFNSLLEENLSVSHKEQFSEIQDMIRQRQALLEAAAVAYQTIDVSKENDLEAALEATAQGLDVPGGAAYYSEAGLRQAQSDMSLTQSCRDGAAKLLGGETIVSDIIPPENPEALGSFCIAVPIRLKDGRMIGAFGCQVPADVLVGSRTRQEWDSSETFLLKRQGDMILDAYEYVGGDDNLFDVLESLKVDDADINRIEAQMLAGEPFLLTQDSPRGGKFFMMATDLGYNDWILLTMSHSNEIRGYSSLVLRNTRILVITAFVIVILLAGIAVGGYLYKKEKLRRNQARYDLLARFSDTILFEYDCISKTLIFTPNISEHFNIRNETVFYPFDEHHAFDMIHPEDLTILQEMLKGAETSGGDATKEIDIRFLNREGEYRWMLCQGQLLRAKRGRAIAIVGKISDIHDQKVAKLKLIEHFSKDAMTGTLNRETAQAQIQAMLGTVDSGYFYMLDVDDFKQINDTYGHLAGDQLLRSLAGRIMGEFRKNDIVARIGGDEFIVFMPGSASKAAARERAQGLLKAVSESLEIHCSLSIGIAAFPKNGTTYDALYKAADAAMYQAKGMGKNNFCFAETE